MPVTKSYGKAVRQAQAEARQAEYDALTPEEKKAKSDEWKNRNK